MKTINRFSPMLGLIGALALGGCSTTSNPPDSYNYGTSNPYNNNPYSTYNNSEYGVVHSIDRVRQGNSIGLGTIAGAVVGGVVGNQFGEGKGNTAATVLGAAGGAYAGNRLENRDGQRSDEYKITVRMGDGSYQSVMENTDTNFRVGDRVRIYNGRLQRY